MDTKMFKAINKRQKFFLIVATVFLGLMIYLKGYQALRGILWGWGFHQGRLGYLLDHITCRVGGIDNCVVGYDELTVNFGAYDPGGRMAENSFIAIDHYFVDWNDSKFIDKLHAKFLETDRRNRWTMLTVEPWSRHGDTGENILEIIKDGEYDRQINQICSQVDKSPQPVFIRWGHEMENLIGRYPWSTENHQDFIKAYNHFVETCREATDNGYYVWSPTGNINLVSYWPDEKNVDYIGLSLFVFPEYEKRNFGYVRHFEQIFQKKYDLVKNYNKPVMIAELGITGDKNFAFIWWSNALKNLNKFNQLLTIVYFNAKGHPNVWKGYSPPDWTIKDKIYPVVH
jgi:beta-mannanase